ncbi:4,5-DOPA dioxygenase extradiol [Hoeflea marina]|uniref:4,5-DOPA dioxygenase extradiol n=1 Tax=Hoeflea marina TaxID=274592 RepID=A0A317PU36_9HYPH|nr:class III extradiol ring-cleavage dioxygenase [Hoeflea marina]PWW04447.1 4,5-DOPA dioxygenase extradiol [Hoeflea marina]
MSDPSAVPATDATAMPSLFISHGSPDTAIADTSAAAFLRRAAGDLPRPKAIVVVSAHFEVSGGTAVLADAKPQTVHDFGGFQQELYEMQYPAPGDPGLATAIVDSLVAQGFHSQPVSGHGFDHGVWVPLKLMYPDADIPVVAVSVDPRAGPDYHLRLGHALAGLGRQGVLVIGSGSFTHNLREAFVALRQGNRDPAVQPWVTDFVDWMNGRLAAGDSTALLDYRRQAPFAERNHPTDEHLLPLYAAMGAAGEAFIARQLHDSNEFGVLSMAMWRFDAAA